MYKNLIIISLFIRFAHADTGRINLDKQLPLSELHQQTKEGESLRSTPHTIKGNYIEDKQRNKNCKDDQIQLLSDITESYDSGSLALPATKKIKKLNTPLNHNNFARDFLPGSVDYYNKKENNYPDSVHLIKDRASSYDKEKDEHFLPSNRKGIDFEPTSFDNNNPLNQVPYKIDTGEYTNLKKCGKFDEMESLPATRRILPGILKNPSDEDLKDNKLIQIKPRLNRNDDVKNQFNQHQIYIPNTEKVVKNYDIDNRNEINDNELEDNMDTIMEDSLRSHALDPTKGEGIYNMMNTNVMLLENSRVCYACSTMKDPSCWAPDRGTVVKYCQKGHHSCLTKTFKYKETSYLIRDCGSYCVSPNNEKYSTCSICHSDLCNGASTVSIYNTGFAIIILLGIMYNKN